MSTVPEAERLRGRVVATTRGDDPDDALTDLLDGAGATVVRWSTYVVDPPADSDPLDRAVAALDGFDWVAFTSPRAVDAVVERAAHPPASARTAAVGDATARALTRAGWPVTVVGAEGAETLVRTWTTAHSLAGARVLFPASSLARPVLEEALRAAGADVTRVEAYRTRIDPPDSSRVLIDLGRGVDVVTFASPSAVTSLREALGDAWPDALLGSGIAAIGPTTRDALVDAGLSADRVHVPDEPGLEGLMRATVSALGDRRLPPSARPTPPPTTITPQEPVR